MSLDRVHVPRPGRAATLAEPMSSTGRVALLTEQHLVELLTDAAWQAATQVLELSRPERGLKVAEVADRLSCAESTVYGLVERGTLPAVRLGSAIRVLESALNDWIRAQVPATTSIASGASHGGRSTAEQAIHPVGRRTS